MVLTIGDLDSVGMVYNWILGIADLWLRYSSRICCLLPTNSGRLCALWAGAHGDDGNGDDGDGDDGDGDDRDGDDGDGDDCDGDGVGDGDNSTRCT